jgi:hypothetical protein
MQFESLTDHVVRRTLFDVRMTKFESQNAHFESQNAHYGVSECTL